MDGVEMSGNEVGEEEGVIVVGAADSGGFVGFAVGAFVSASVGSNEFSKDRVCEGVDVGALVKSVGGLDARKVGGDVSSET